MLSYKFDGLDKLNELAKLTNEFVELDKLNCKFDELSKLRMSSMSWIS